MEVLMGKSSINGPFSMAMLNNHRVKQYQTISNISLDLSGPVLDLFVSLRSPGSRGCRSRNAAHWRDSETWAAEWSPVAWSTKIESPRLRQRKNTHGTTKIIISYLFVFNLCNHLSIYSCVCKYQM